MLIFRHFIIIGVSVVVCLGYRTSVTAQELTSLNKSSDSAVAASSVAQIPQMNNEGSTPDTPQISPGTEPASSTENLDPSANPLLFPTKPEEVEVKEEVAVTLQQAIELALRNNKDLQTAKLTLERSRADLRAALALELPTIGTQVQFSRDSSASAEQQNESRRQAGASEITEESTNINGSLTLNYNIYTGGERGARIRQAEKQVRSDSLNIEVASATVRFNATRDYYNLQNADAQVEIERAAVNDAAQSLRDAQLLEQAGLGTRFDVLQAEVDLANNNQRLTQAFAAQRQARRQIVQTLGVGPKVGLIAADKIQEAGAWNFSLEESIVQAFKNRAELEQQLLQREISEEQRKIELAAIKPQVSFIASYNLQDNFDDDFTVADGYSFATRVNWNLFDGGVAKARAERAIKQKEIAEVNFANQRDTIRLDVENAYYDLTANQENIQTSQKNVERAEERLRLARLRFQAGVGTQTEVIDAQRDLTQARGSYFQAIIGYNQALNQLQRAVSNLPDNRLFDLP